MSIADRIQAINDHLIDDYKVLRLAGADLTGVNKNIVNLKMSWKERLLYFMNYGTEEVWNNWTKVNGTGTTLSLNNTEEAPMSLTYKGNTSQSGTPTPSSPIPVQVVSGDNSIEVVGKNLFNLNSTNRVNVSLGTLSITGTGKDFTISSTAYYDAVAFYIGIIDYDTIYKYLSSPYVAGSMWLCATNSNSYSSWSDYSSDRTVITSDWSQSSHSLSNYQGKHLWLQLRGSTDASGYSSVNYKDFVLSKTQATTYEEYKGASYPISLGNKELCKIGTYQDKIDKSTGTNLFDKNTVTDNAWLLENGTLSTGHSGYYVSDFIPVKPNTAYYKLNSGSVRNKYYDKNKQPLNTTTYQDIDIGGVSGTFTTAQNCYYIRITFTSNGVVTLDNFMINEGTTSLPYEPYGTGWYLKKEIGKVSNLSSYYRDLTTNYNNLQYIRINKMTNSANYGNSSNIPVIFTHGIYQVITSFDQAVNIGRITSSGGYTYFYFGVDKTTTVEQAQTLLSNATIYYPLSTPTYEYITDTTLLSQLEALKKSYESVTNISQVNNDLPFELSVTALEVMS